jgi:hypothetical protein
VEALDFAAGLWVIGARADVGDAELAETDLQGGAPAAPWGGGKDGAVVGQYRSRGAEAGERGQEGVDHVRAGHGGSGLWKRRWSLGRFRLPPSPASTNHTAAAQNLFPSVGLTVWDFTT